ncbi:NusG domain II-containing protein [Sporolactobacillus nakayamae]|nr:NusG domain II-containing protein [Sporolactobacillus nakayamae]
MSSYFKMIKRWDIIIVALLILISFLPFAIFSAVQAKTTTSDVKNRVATVTLDNKQIRKIKLTGNTRTFQFTVHSGDGDENVIEVRKNQIRIKSANCPDQNCVLVGYISKPGETIVCLPHHLVIEVKSDTEATQDIIVSS